MIRRYHYWVLALVVLLLSVMWFLIWTSGDRIAPMPPEDLQGVPLMPASPAP